MLNSYWIKSKAHSLKKGLLLLLVFCAGISNSFAQLSDLHYLPPLKSALPGTSFTFQRIYLSTPVTSTFSVDVYQGANPNPIATISLSASTPNIYSLSAGTNNDGENNITLLQNAYTGGVINSAGLRFQSRNGEKFYVNWRGNAGAQASSLVSKGRAALGTSFKWGGVPNMGTGYPYNLNACVGIMATENNTKVHIFGYDPACTFRWGSNPKNYNSSNPIGYITLNAGETIVIEAPYDTDDSPSITTVNPANIAGWLGASIVSDKDIAVSIGELNFNPVNIGGMDAGMDQIIPEKSLGKEYVFVRMNGTDFSEFPVIIATQNNTAVYVNNETTPITTLNTGQYFSIPGSKWSSTNPSGSKPGENMYVRTTQPVYAFQSVAGSSIGTGLNLGYQTCDINFIAPVNWLLNKSLNCIPTIEAAGPGLTVTGGITILAASSVNPSDIIIKYGATGTIAWDPNSLIGLRKSISGTSNWYSYYIAGLTGNVSVSATGPIAVGYFGYNGNAGISGYFSGFESIPTIMVTKVGDGCLPSTILSATAGFDAYQWRKSGVILAGETGQTYTPTSAGTYTVEVFRNGQSYESASQSVYDCKPEIIVTNVADQDSLISGETTTFRITVKYLGEGQVDNLVVRNVIPPHMTVLSTAYTYPGSGRTNSITPVTGTSNFDWNIGTLYNDEDRVLTVVAKANAVTALTRETYTVSTTQIFSGVESNKSADDFTEDIAIYGSCTPAMSGDITGNNPVCAGNSASLNLSNYIGAIQWQKSSDNSSFTDITGANSANYNATNLNTDTYYRTKVVFGSCINYATAVKVTVNPLPSLGAITGPSAINTDYVRLYSNSTSGGTWSCTNPAVATIDASGSLTGKRGGSTVITYSLTNANGCSSSVTKSVNVIQTIRTALIKSGQLSADSTLMTNRNGAKGFGSGRDFTGEIFSVPNTPKITTATISAITSTAAVSGGTIISNGGRAIIARGVVWDTATNPTISLSTKTSDGSGDGAFTSNITGLLAETIYYVRSYVTTSLGTSYGDEITFGSLSNTVTSATGRVWMNSNLGATQVATSSTDVASYGDLYQWGRGTDGHQLRNSPTTNTLSNSDQPGNGLFILTSGGDNDWRSGQNINLWQGVNGINNPCPTGFRIPTKTEWEAEIATWSSLDGEGAFSSPLKLPKSGNRSYLSGGLGNLDSYGVYWSSTVNGTQSYELIFGPPNTAFMRYNQDQRGFGSSCRCIKD